MRKRFPFERFDTPTHRAWKRDRLHRQRVPLADSWRGCIGLSMFWRNVDNAECHGGKIFYPNDNLVWAAMRDVPVGHFPACRTMNRRAVLYTSLAAARLQYGMPSIDFSRPTRDAWDLARMPMDLAMIEDGSVSRFWPGSDVVNSTRQSREFSVFTQMTTAMTVFAATARNRQGWLLRPMWARQLGRTFRHPPKASIAQVFPVPYLGFRQRDEERLFWFSTSRGIARCLWRCPSCGAIMEARCLRSTAAFDQEDSFSARCPRCSAAGRWSLDEEVICQGRQFGRAFRDGFCRALEDGLTLRATQNFWYEGVFKPEPQEGNGPDLIRHVVISQLDHRHSIVQLPRSAVILAQPASFVAAGDEWARLVPVPTMAWRQQPDRHKWASLSDVCDKRSLIGRLQMLWFESQAVRLLRRPELVYYPAALVASAVNEIVPEDLIWECDRLGDHIDADSEAVVFPPVRQSRWDMLRFNVGDVQIDAGVGDPRFRLEISETTNRPRRWPRMIPAAAMAG